MIFFSFFFSFIFISWKLITLQVVIFAIYWHESAMDLHVFPIPIPPPNSLPIPSLWVFPVHQPWALVSCIQPGLVIFLSTHACTLSLCHGWLFETPWTVVCQVPLFMGFSGQEYLSSIFILQGDLSSDPGIESASPVSPVLAGSFFTPEPLGSLPHL